MIDRIIDNTDESWFWNGSRDQPSKYASQAEWCDAVIRRLHWLHVCQSPLGANLAIAGALTRAFRLGDTYAWSMAWSDVNFRSQHTDEWHPNIKGVPAP